MAAFAPIASLAALSFSPTSLAAPPRVAPVHALAMHGEPKYGPNFAHFEYVNPNASRGGRIRLGVRGTFDTFHPFIPKGNPGAGDATETLLTQSEDEPFTEYGLLAESIEVPDDRSWVAFTLRPEARWHDGRPVSVDDVIWSFTTLTTKGHPSYRFYYASVASAEKIGPRRVRFGFKEKENRELPLIVGQLPILPKHYWEERDFERTTLEPPLGSGPYRISAFEAGRYIVTERVDDYWGRHLAVNRGRNNFERIRYDYYRDDTVIRQALKAGEIRLPGRESGKGMGPRLRRAGGSQWVAEQGGDRAPTPDRDAGVRDEHPPGNVQGSPSTPGAGVRLRLRVDQPEPVLRAVHENRELFLQLRARVDRAARRPRARDPGALPRSHFRGGLHHDIPGPGYQRQRLAAGKSPPGL